MFLLHRLFDQLHQVVVGLDGFELRELLLNRNGSMKQKPNICLAEHRGVVEGITGGDDVIIEKLQGRNRLLFLVRLAQAIIDDAVVLDFEFVAKERGPIELLHQRLGELLEGVREDDDLRDCAEFVQKFLAAGQGAQRRDDLLDVGQFEAMLVEQVEPALHEDVVVRHVARGKAQLADAGFFCDSNPDFRHQHAFQVQCDDGLFHQRSFPKAARAVQRFACERSAAGLPLTSKLVFLFLEQNVEGGHRAVAAGDVLLHLDFLGVAQFFMGVDFLFKHAELVAHGDDFVEEDFQRDFLGLQRRVGGMQDDLAVLPARTELVDDGVGLLQSELRDGGLDGALDKLFQWDFCIANFYGRLRDLDIGEFGINGPQDIAKTDVGGVCLNFFHGSLSVMRVGDFHARRQNGHIHNVNQYEAYNALRQSAMNANFA